MAMVCPKCNGTYEQRLNCPQCDVRLLYQAPRRLGFAGEEESWQQTPWGRLLIGLVLAQGLYYGLRQLCTAVILANNDELARELWTTRGGLILLQGLQAVGVLAAGILVGAGQRQAFIYGALLGMWGGVLDLVVQGLTGRPMTTVVALGLPMLQAAFGALGSMVGSAIWKPLQTLTLPSSAGTPGTRKAGPRNKSHYFAGPIAWLRVGTGVAVAVGGALWAHVILELVVQASEGKLLPETKLQSELVTWEIMALVMTFGSALAGATTKNPLKQGLCVGVGTATVLLGVNFATPVLPVPALLFTLTCSLGLGLLGSWFGGQLFPPLVVPRRRRGGIRLAA